MLQAAVEGAVPEGTSAEEISAMVEAAVEAAQQPALSPADIENAAIHCRYGIHSRQPGAAFGI